MGELFLQKLKNMFLRVNILLLEYYLFDTNQTNNIQYFN